MNDRGEKIVNLAREMLRSEFSFEAPKTTSPNTLASSVKAVCLAAFLAAFGTLAVTHTIHEARRPLNRYERVELDALLFYASRMKSLNEPDLKQDMLSRLARSDMDDLTRADFDKARDYLQGRLK